MFSFLKKIWPLITPYWKSSEKWMAWLLLGVIIGLNLGEVYINVLLNKWNNDFYNSLQNVDKDAFVHALIKFSYLAVSFIVVVVYKTYLNQMLRIKWRKWLTAHYLTDWLAKQNYYRIQLFSGHSDNPDQRISEDIEQFIQLTLGLSLGLLSSVVTLFSFLFILWELSGALDFGFNGMAIHIPGYMVWVALVYAIAGTWITTIIGRPLIMLNFNQQRYEADFRFSLVRLRENSESVAFYRGEGQEHNNFMLRFNSVVDNFWQIMKRQKTLTWFTSGYGQIATIFPFVVCAPRFFSGAIKLGGLMQTASAFGQVQGALSYIVDAYTSIATWRAVIDRLHGFKQNITNAENLKITANIFTQTQSNEIQATDLTVKLPNGTALLSNINMTIKPGDSVLISGASGVGKSTLLRTLAGIWPFTEGKISIPAQAKVLFIPQRPYLPLGTLRAALCYPDAPNTDDKTVSDILLLCGLAHLAPKLDDVELWSHNLSIGEQQRIGFVRLLLIKPDFAFLDEATSALDEPAEVQLYKLLREKLPNMALVSVGHRSTLRAWHATETILSNH